jgi:hypothetical protein
MIRHVTVAVGVMFDPDRGFYLCRNNNWHGDYAFVMKKCPPGEDAAEMALTALGDDSPEPFPDATASPAAVVGAFGKSARSGQETYYEYHVYELAPGDRREGVGDDQLAKFFPYEDLQESPQVTWSTKAIAKALVEFQEVCVGVISRPTASGPEFLLTYHPSYGYFFPSARRKTDAPAEEMAVQAVRWETGYTGELSATLCWEESDIHTSGRYGVRNREYRYHVCRIDVCGVNLAASGNPLESSIVGLAGAMAHGHRHLGPRGYWSWFTESELRNGTGISPTVRSVLLAAIRCAERGN